MKVLILQKYLAPYRINLFNTINKLVKNGLMLLYYGKYETRRKWNILKNNEFLENHTKSFNIKINYEKNINIPFLLYFDIKKIKPDVIIAAPDFAGVIVYLYSKINSVPYILWLESNKHNEIKTGKIKTKIKKILFNAAESLIIPGRMTNEYLTSLNININKHIAKNSIDLGQFLLKDNEIREKYLRINKFVITFSGSLVKRKGFNLLLNAITKLNSIKDIHLFKLNIIGDGPKGKIKINNVIYHGFLEGKQYFEKLKGSHIFILPSYYDCNPLTMIEAAASGNILICSEAVGNHYELIENNGFVIPVNDEDSIVNILVKLFNTDKEILADMGISSMLKSLSFNHFDSARSFCKAITDAYEEN